MKAQESAEAILEAAAIRAVELVEQLHRETKGDTPFAIYTLTIALQTIHAATSADDRGHIEARLRNTLTNMYETPPMQVAADGRLHLHVRIRRRGDG